ncbi:MAG: ABC transporter permease [Candidatus Avoscillospira sp.]
MLAEKNGLKSTWRSPGKTCLFFLLLLALTAVLSLGLCIFNAVQTYLDQCDDYYRTIAELEYVGAGYGDSTVYDSQLAEFLSAGSPDLEAMARLPGVLSWEPSRSGLGVTEGFHRTDSGVYDPDAAVLILRNLFWDSKMGAYVGTVSQCLYSRTDMTNVMVFVQAGEGQTLDQSSRYVFVGRYVEGSNSYAYFLPEDFLLEQDGQEITLPAYSQVPAEGLPEDSPYQEAARILGWRNNGLRVQMVSDLETYRPFQQEELTLIQGRAFTRDEQEAGAKVCVISDRIAELLGVTVGDSLSLSVNCVQGGIFTFHGLDPAAAEAYTVVGLYGWTKDYTDWIFVPDGPDYAADPCPTGYVVGQFLLENDKTEAFYETAAALLPMGFRLTVYDQGYAVTAAPFRELLRIAAIFLMICCLVILAVLALFGYLFVYRQREAARTMAALGSGKLHVYRYFASGSGVLVLLASVLGVLLSSRLEQKALQFLEDFAKRYQAADLRFSSGSLSVSRTLAFSPQTPSRIYLLAAGLMVLGVLAACAVFTAAALREKKPRRKRPVRAPKHAGRSSHLSGRLKYALLSLRRGGMRTAAVALLALIVAVFLGQLTATADLYRDQLAAITGNTTFRGYSSSLNGLQMDRLVVRAEPLQALYDTGIIEDMDVSCIRAHYRYLGMTEDPGGRSYSVSTMEAPRNDYLLETLTNQMARGPLLTATTSLTRSPAFYYTLSPEITWLEGYSEECLRGYDESLCVVPTTLMEREGFPLGSKIRLFTMVTVDGQDGSRTYFDNEELTVVGCYVPVTLQETIYTPLGYVFPMGIQPEEESSIDPYDYIAWDGTDVIPLSEDNPEARTFLEDVWGTEHLASNAVAEYLEKLLKEGGNLCVISQALLAQWREDPDIFVRDGMRVAVANPSRDAVQYYYVIGVFEKTDPDMGDIYCSPMTADLVDPLHGEGLRLRLSSITYGSAIFTLKQDAGLTRFRDALEESGFTEPGVTGNVRNCAVIDDKDYNAAVSSLERQVRYLDALYKFLYALTGIIGLTASFLLVNFRKGELAIMRGLGAQPVRIFLNFFLEQLLLVLLGCGLGMGLWALLGRPFETLYFPLVGMYLACWALGAAVSILMLLRSKALAVLSDRE